MNDNKMIDLIKKVVEDPFSASSSDLKKAIGHLLRGSSTSPALVGKSSYQLAAGNLLRIYKIRAANGEFKNHSPAA